MGSKPAQGMEFCLHPSLLRFPAGALKVEKAHMRTFRSVKPRESGRKKNVIVVNTHVSYSEVSVFETDCTD